MAEDKTEGTSHEVAILGIELNVTDMCTSLPPDKLAKLRTMVKEFAVTRVVRSKQLLESLVGHLVHAAAVFPLGKAFFNALFAAQAAIKPGQTRRLNLAAHSELAWWDLLLEHWPSISVHQFLLLKQPDQHTYVHRHIRILGLWCLVCTTLVPNTVYQRVDPANDCPQRITANHGSCSNMG